MKSFLIEGRQSAAYNDSAFGAMDACRRDMIEFPDLTVNATAGTFWGADGRIAAYKTVYDLYDSIDPKRKAAYATDLLGNKDYRDAVFSWLNRLGNIRTAHSVIASPGGTGAVAFGVFNCVEKGDELLIPDIGWINYRVMVEECGAVPAYYSFLEGAEGAACNVSAADAERRGSADAAAQSRLGIADLKAQSRRIMEKQGRLTVVINDPCQNPTGASFGPELWADLMEFYNELSAQGPVVIINDVAYLDYSEDPENATRYFDAFGGLSENVAVLLAFSCSKLLTVYGLRLGACVILTQKQEDADSLQAAFVRYARSNWGTVNNSLMQCFVEIVRDHKDALLAEKQQAIDALSERSLAFIEASRACGLELYPYFGGFFVTVRVSDPGLLQRFDAELKKDHIYGVKYPGGMRFAICALQPATCASLPARVKAALERAEGK